MAATITIGYKFIQTDNKLVLHYLIAKAKGQPLPVEGLVNECNLYDDQELSKIFSKPIHDNEGRLTGHKRSFCYINRESSEHSVWDMKEL
ncbi:hypothetical protein CsSME_00000345 [Camellia sinensis var. sinensis]